MDDMDDRGAAARDLERIRVLMERAGRFSHLSATAVFVAGGLAVLGVLLSWGAGADFSDPGSARPLSLIWGSVLVVALGQGLAFTMIDARRRGDPLWGPLTRQVAMAMLPAFFVGAAVTAFGVQTGQLEILPPFWSLAHGSSLVALGLFAGRRIQAVGLLLLLWGAGALFLWKGHGLRVMLGAFGGGHMLLGALITWKRPRSAA
jgi:hypothetical protein